MRADDAINWAIEKSNEYNALIRQLEDRCAELSVDPKNDRAYIALAAYRAALTDLLHHLRSLDGPKSSGYKRG